MKSEKSNGLWIFVLITVFTAAISGCATLGKDECLQADWYTIGYEDGARGYQTSRIGQHREACARHGVTPDFKRYAKGHNAGLVEYCTFQKGYALGSAGKKYNYVCQTSLERDFHKGYQQGKIYYTAKKEVQQAQDRLNKIDKDIDTLEQTLDAYEKELVRNGTSPKRRRYLLEEIKRLTDEHRYLLDQAADQETVLEAAEFNFRKLQQQAIE